MANVERIKELTNRITDLSTEELTELGGLVQDFIDELNADPDRVVASAELASLEIVASAAEALTTEEKRRTDRRSNLAANLRTVQIPADRRPVFGRTPSASALTASGRELHDGSDIAGEFASVLRQNAARPTAGRTLVASVKAADNGVLRASDSVEENTAMLRAQSSAITAAGGFGAPAPVEFALPSFGESQARPLRDAFPNVVSERGQITFLRNIGLSDLAGSASVWDAQDDIDALTVPETRKPFLRAPFPTDVTVQTEAVVSYLVHGNLSARAWPEHLNRVLELANLAHTVLSEQRLLASLDALSVGVTVAAGSLGAARQVIPSIAIAAAGVRSRLRLDPSTNLQVVLPATFRTVVKIDLQRQHPGDRALEISDADVDNLFAVHNLSPVYSLDHQVVPSQAAGALTLIEDDLVAYLVVPGSTYVLDGGTLDIGIFRDSDLIAANDFGSFFETFQALVVSGLAPVKLTIAGSVPSGKSAAAV